MSETMKQFSAARRASVPLMIWKTPDAASTMSAVKAVADYPVFSWDITRGIMPVNEAGVLAQAKIPKDEDGNPLTGVGNPPEMLATMQALPSDTVMFMQNAHLFTASGNESNSAVVQGVWNLRDTNKEAHRTLVMLAPQMRTPIELSNDVLVIDEKLPDESQLKEIVEAQVKHAKTGAKDAGVKFKELSAADLAKAIGSLSGLSAFAAEQTVAVSFEKDGDGVSLNQETLWERKRQAIEETRGLKVWRSGETLDDVKGCSNVKKFAKQIIGGRMSPRVIVFMDEIEKTGVAAGSRTGDSSNTDQLGVVLVRMQDTGAQGMLLVGHAGSAKSMFAKAFGNSAGIVTIQMDLGAMKGDGLVGQAEGHIRNAMNVIDAVSQGRALYIATCNKIDALPPELKRRFTLGTFFFDLPTMEEREAIWKGYVKKFKLERKGFSENLSGGYSLPFDDEGWTGSDIFNCCYRAWNFNTTLADAAKYATPICRQNPAAIEALRSVADNAFISANYEGLYQRDKQTVKVAAKRKMEFN